MSKEIEKFKGGLINNSSIIKKGLEISKKAEDPFAGMTEDEMFEEGSRLFDQRKYEEAIEYLSKCILIYPDCTDLLWVRGKSFIEMGRYEKAIKDITIFISQGSDGGTMGFTAYCTRGKSYHEIKSYEKAVEDFTKCIYLFPYTPYAYYLRGKSYIEMGRYEKAIEDFTEAISQDPNDSDKYWWRGNSYEKLGFKDLAENDYKESERLRKK